MTGGANAVAATERAGVPEMVANNRPGTPGPDSLSDLRAIHAAKVRADSRARLLPVFERTKGMKPIDRLLAISGACRYRHPDDRAIWCEVMREMEAEGL